MKFVHIIKSNHRIWNAKENKKVKKIHQEKFNNKILEKFSKCENDDKINYKTFFLFVKD